ncbi:MAG: serine/threonine protein kinase [Dehalococcoidia bacterium]|nr:serine/threonine protein kinase [Dehalococcoidia bacterium]
MGWSVVPAAVPRSLGHNQVTTLPEGLGQLTQLRSLELLFNQLAALPEWLGRLAQIQSLNLSYNQLTALPEWLRQLTQLRSFDLRSNHLTDLPYSLAQLAQLQELHLSGNPLTVLPEWLGQLSQLQSLNVAGNQLTAVPEGLGQLSQLQSLDLQVNQLTALPDWLGRLTRLQSLDLVDNQLEVLPNALRELSALRELYLHGNPMLGLPPEVLGPARDEVQLPNRPPAAPTEILEYYFRTRGEPQPLNEAKLILVGHGFVGKTSLVNRLVHDTFDEGEKQTEGIQITPWPIQLGDEDVRLHIWDFGGQEIMHATHQFFLTQRSLYLLVLSGRQGHEDADADYWLNLIQSFGEDSPVIVVLNKIKDLPFDVNRRALRQKFPAIRAFIETDCADRMGIDELQQVIERETDRLEHLRDAFPASWFSIKDRLAGMKENYLPFEQYQEICSDLGEADAEAQRLLASYLHTLGIALNYREDPRLQDTHVLNPHWVTNGIYTTLNADYLARQRGELSVSDLGTILDPAAYPPERHEFLLELMRRFELCFSFPEDGDRYLIPELLDKQQPVEAEEFQPEACLNFHYRYPILPEGLLPRFIVRTHTMSTGQSRWRTGVILEFEGNTALVKADVQDKRVFVAVTGPTAGRQRLLAAIRSDLESIHSSFSFQPRAMVPVPGHPDPDAAIPYRKLVVMEREGKAFFDEVVGDDVVTIDVRELLNGVDPDATRRDEEGDRLRASSERAERLEAQRAAEHDSRATDGGGGPRITIHGNVTGGNVGAVGADSLQQSIAYTQQLADVRQLVERLSASVAELPLPSEDRSEMLAAITELDDALGEPNPRPSRVRRLLGAVQSLRQVFPAIEQAGDTVAHLNKLGEELPKLLATIAPAGTPPVP